MNIEISDLFGAVVNMGADPYIIETEEQAEELRESIEAATIEREITDEDEYNRVVTKAQFQAYEKCMELLQPVVIPNAQTKSSDGYITRNS